MTLLTAYEIANNYPDNILIDAAQDKTTNKWLSAMYLIRNAQIHKTMLSFEINEGFSGFDSKEVAVAAMNEVAQAAIKYITENFSK